MALEVPGGVLHGTLQRPSRGSRAPVVLIVAGSGPTDRNGNSAAIPGRNDSLRLLAEGLASRGYSSLRYDKRGIGESRAAGADESGLRFEALIDDVVAWVELLGATPGLGPMALLGHSEGALLAMLAAQRPAAARVVRAVVSLAGAGRPAPDILRDQLAGQLPPELLVQVDVVLGHLREGRRVEPLPSAIARVPALAQALFRPSVQPYLIEWFAYDPADVIAELQVPTLVLQGTTDLQVPVRDAQRLQEAAPTAYLHLIDGMNHVLRVAPPDPEANMATYRDPANPLSAGLLAALEGFLGEALAA
jgi:hypothetical protein